MNRRVAAAFAVATLALVAGCEGSIGAPGSTAKGSDGVHGTLTYTEHEVSDIPISNSHKEFDDTIVLNIKVNEPEEGRFVDAGSTYTRHGTDKGTCVDEHWDSAGTVNVNDDASLTIQVDRHGGHVLIDAYIGAELLGTTGCPAKSVKQTAMEWTNVVDCTKATSREDTITGDPLGVLQSDGRTVAFNCSSLHDKTEPVGGQHIRAEITLTGQLDVAPR